MLLHQDEDGLGGQLRLAIVIMASMYEDARISAD